VPYPAVPRDFVGTRPSKEATEQGQVPRLVCVRLGDDVESRFVLVPYVGFPNILFQN